MRRRRLNKRKFEKYQTDKRTVGVGNIPTSLPIVFGENTLLS